MGDAVKRKKPASDVTVTSAPPIKSRLLEKSTSLSASYDFADHVTREPLVPRMSELEVSANSL